MKAGFLLDKIIKVGSLIVILLVACAEKKDIAGSNIKWENGHPVATDDLKCATCHEKDRPATKVTLARTTESGKEYTVSFHNFVPTGFNEDPTYYNDCNKCHSQSLGWKAGTFGPAGKPHLADSKGNKVSVCTDCHDYPQNFWRTEHSFAKTKGYDCQTCHFGPNEVGGTQRGGFGTE